MTNSIKNISKKLICVLMMPLLVLLFSSCGNRGALEQPKEKTSPVILCADFAEYDWVRNILGDNPGNIELQLLNETGIDMHSFQPTVQDMVKIHDCNLLIYVGGVSEFWVDNSLNSNEVGTRTALSLMVEYAGHEHVHNHDHDHGHSLSHREEVEDDHDLHDEEAEDDHDHDIHDEEIDDDHDHDIHDEEIDDDHDHDVHDEEVDDNHDHDEEEDEHIWLSPIIAEKLVSAIAEEIEILDPENAEYYHKNEEAYIEKLHELDNAYHEAVENSNKSTLLFCDRYPFAHLMDEYHIETYAAFPGCEAEAEASFETIVKLANLVDQLELDTVIILEGSDGALAETILNASERAKTHDLKVSVLNSMQSISKEDMKDGLDYLTIMYNNLEVIKDALK